MADVRALLKAKRQEAKVSHPLASYTASGQLKCIACGTIVKQAAAWNGHVGSKSHRTNVARLKDEERAREALLAQQSLSKRKASDHDDEDDEPLPDSLDPKRPKLDQPVSSGFPTDFFSDPSKAPPLQAEDESDQEDQSADTQPATAASQDVIDLEWQQFQQAMLNPPEADIDTRDTYDRATVMAEPVLNDEVPAGFPPRPDQAAEAEPEEELDEDALRKRKELDERELIMDRLLEEERLQEEADAKVSMLKNKLEMIKKRREAAKAAKAKKA
ncbi:hypothetical protein QCA50_010951 [Cerrena zonata]|uniref:Coiled-coil domain-containing protein 16 n=1 Tax=Cerrena zonata TaxID=2478898 RepID=A0AAW0G756_9APHY